MEPRYFEKISDNPIRYRELNEANGDDASHIYKLENYTLPWRFCFYEGIKFGFCGDFVIVSEDFHRSKRTNQIPCTVEKNFTALAEQFHLVEWKEEHYIEPRTWFRRLKGIVSKNL